MKLKIALMVGLFSALLTWNYAQTPATNGAAATAPAASPGAEAFAKITSDFGTLRTAHEVDPAAKQKMITSLFGEASDFLGKYPGDAHAGDVTILWAQLGEVLEANHLPGAPTEAEMTKRLNALATDAKAPQQQRAGIRAMQINLALQKAMSPGSTSANWDALEARFDTFEKEFGDDYSMDGQHPILPSLRSEELTVLQQSPDQGRYNALVKKLAASSSPQLKQLAEQAQAAQQKTASLKSKPLDLKFTSVDGKPIDVAQMRGKVVLVDFWATWCPPCRGEVPDVVAAYKKYHDKGFEIVGISLDQDKSALTTFTKSNGMEWPQYFDGKGWDNDISKGFGIDSIPAMWLVDKKGMLVTMEGREDLDGQVAKLLAAP